MIALVDRSLRHLASLAQTACEQEFVQAGLSRFVGLPY